MSLTCYDYLKASEKRNGNFPAAIAFGCKTSLTKLMRDIDSLAGYINSIGIGDGDDVTVFLPTVILLSLLFMRSIR